MAGEVLAGDGAVLAADGAGEEAPAVGDGRDLVVAGGVDRLAAVQRLEGGEGVGLCLDAVGDAEEGTWAMGAPVRGVSTASASPWPASGRSPIRSAVSILSSL